LGTTFSYPPPSQNSLSAPVDQYHVDSAAAVLYHCSFFCRGHRLYQPG